MLRRKQKEPKKISRPPDDGRDYPRADQLISPLVEGHTYLVPTIEGSDRTSLVSAMRWDYWHYEPLRPREMIMAKKPQEDEPAAPPSEVEPIDPNNPGAPRVPKQEEEKPAEKPAEKPETEPDRANPVRHR